MVCKIKICLPPNLAAGKQAGSPHSGGRQEKGKNGLVKKILAAAFAHRHSLILIAAICSAGLVFLPDLAYADDGRGPLRTRNQYPPHLMFLTPLPDTASLIPGGTWQLSLSVDYSSVHVNQRSTNWEALIDMEMGAVAVMLEYGAADFLTISFEAPFVSMSKGFMDGFLENYHNALGVPNYEREKRPKNEFGYDMREKGRPWFNAEPGGLHPADSVLSAKIPLLKEAPDRSFSASMVYAVKLPTGDYTRGFGSGRFDHGIFVLTKTRISPVIVYFNSGGSLIAPPKTAGAHVETAPSIAVFLGVEYPATERLSLMAQVNAYTSPIKNTDIPQLDDPGVELGLGFNYGLLPSSSLEFAFCEDLIALGAPDFNIHLRFTHRFQQ